MQIGSRVCVCVCTSRLLSESRGNCTRSLNYLRADVIRVCGKHFELSTYFYMYIIVYVYCLLS